MSAIPRKQTPPWHEVVWPYRHESYGYRGPTWDEPLAKSRVCLTHGNNKWQTKAKKV